jgi:hypothetical protein
VREDFYQLGPTASITDARYWKIDSVRAWPKGTSLMLRLAGHQIQDASPFRRMGQGRTTFEIAGVWTPVAGGSSARPLPVIAPGQQTFSDVAPGNPFYRYIEIAAAAGIVGGHADGTFGWGNGVTRGQACKMIVEALWPGVDVQAQAAAKKK